MYTHTTADHDEHRLAQKASQGAVVCSTAADTFASHFIMNIQHKQYLIIHSQGLPKALPHCSVSCKPAHGGNT
jgi:hypothetical protein